MRESSLRALYALRVREHRRAVETWRLSPDPASLPSQPTPKVARIMPAAPRATRSLVITSGLMGFVDLAMLDEETIEALTAAGALVATGAQTGVYTFHTDDDGLVESFERPDDRTGLVAVTDIAAARRARVRRRVRTSVATAGIFLTGGSVVAARLADTLALAAVV